MPGMSVPGDKVMGQEPSTTHHPGLVVPMWYGMVGDEGDIPTEQPSHILDILAKGKGGWPRSTFAVGWIQVPGRPEECVRGGGSTFTPPVRYLGCVCLPLLDTHRCVSSRTDSLQLYRGLTESRLWPHRLHTFIR